MGNCLNDAHKPILQDKDLRITTIGTKKKEKPTRSILKSGRRLKMTNDASITTIKNKRSFLLKDSDLPGMFDPDYTIPEGDDSIICEHGHELEDVAVHNNPGPEYDVDDEEEVPKLMIPYELLEFKYEVGQLGPNKNTIEIM